MARSVQVWQVLARSIPTSRKGRLSGPVLRAAAPRRGEMRAAGAEGSQAYETSGVVVIPFSNTTGLYVVGYTPSTTSPKQSWQLTCQHRLYGKSGRQGRARERRHP